jgi:hypothetical protein
MNVPRTESPGTAAAPGASGDCQLEESANEVAYVNTLDVWADEYSARARRARIRQGKSPVINDPTALARLSVIVNRPMANDELAARFAS